MARNTDLTTQQAANYCGLTLDGFRYHVKQAHISADYKIGPTSMYSIATLDTFKTTKRNSGRPRKTGDGKMAQVSVKSAKDIDGANAYYVTVDSETFAVHTDQHGNGLWIDGKQIEGLSQFSIGNNASAAYRRYFSKRN